MTEQQDLIVRHCAALIREAFGNSRAAIVINIDVEGTVDITTTHRTSARMPPPPRPSRPLAPPPPSNTAPD